jgi:hypothetical protein
MSDETDTTAEEFDAMWAEAVDYALKHPWRPVGDSRRPDDVNRRISYDGQ